VKRSLLALFFIVLLLSGCASVWLIDNDVRTFSSLSGVPTAGYRFERLPSQQSNPDSQNAIEAMAEQALAKVGLRRNDATAATTVQVSARVQRDPRAPWDDPFFGPWPGGVGLSHGQLFAGRGGLSFGLMFGGFESPYYRREVSLVMRELATGKVVYETHAAHDGRWADSQAVLPAMFEAAVSGFPAGPDGQRRVNIEVPR
jgi:Domain of unknown function (DUF4136)